MEIDGTKTGPSEKLSGSRARSADDAHRQARLTIGRSSIVEGLQHLDLPNIATVIQDSDSKVVWISSAFESFFGTQHVKMIGRSVGPIIKKVLGSRIEDPESFVEKLLASYAGRTDIENLECHLLAGRRCEERWLAVSSHAIRSGPLAGGRIDHYTDITKHKRAERKISAVIESAPDAMILSNVDGRIQLVNAQTVALFGYERDELLQAPVEMLMPERFREQHRLHRANFFAKPSVRPMGAGLELYGLHKDGREFPIEMSLSPIETQNGLLAAAAIRDVTDRKRTEESLRRVRDELEDRVKQRTADLQESNERFGRESEAREGAMEALIETECLYRALFERSSNAIMLLDPKTMLPIDFNDEMLRLLGYSRHELARLPVAKYEAQETSEEIEIHRDKVLREGGDDFETKLRTKNGDVRDVQVSIRVIDLSGRKVFHNIFSDITDRKRADTALRDSEERFSKAFRLSPESMSIVRLDTEHIIDVNDRFLDMSGYGREDIVGKTVHEVGIWVDARDRERMIESLRNRESIHGKEFLFRTKSGNLRTGRVSADLIEIGGLECLLTTVEDITQRKRADERARQREAELAHVLRLETMGEMAMGIAHELAQPLTAVMNYGEACRRAIQSGGDSRDVILKDLEAIIAQAERASEIIRHLREFVRKHPARQMLICITATVREAVQFLEAELRAKRVDLRLQMSEANLQVQADPIQIQQVVINLVRNGLEAMEACSPENRQLCVSTSETATGLAEVTVRDSGTGLAAGSVESCFEPFFSSKPRGLGMGLSISRSIIKAHGGALLGSANADRGMTFRFTLPQAKGV